VDRRLAVGGLPPVWRAAIGGTSSGGVRSTATTTIAITMMMKIRIVTMKMARKSRITGRMIRRIGSRMISRTRSRTTAGSGPGSGRPGAPP
jgi:hypothetical protein